MLLVSVMEDKGFSVIFRRGKVLIYREGASPNTTMKIMVREGNLYKLQRNLIQALIHDSDNMYKL